MFYQDAFNRPAPNIYVGKRNFIHQLMDVALLMANVSQLKALLVSGRGEYFSLLLTFICLSISLQVAFTICMIVIQAFEKQVEDLATKATECEHGQKTQNIEELECKHKRNEVWCYRLDKVSNILVLFIIVANVFVAGFGVEGAYADRSPPGPVQ